MDSWWGGLMFLLGIGFFGSVAEHWPLVRTIAVSVLIYGIAFEIDRLSY